MHERVRRPERQVLGQIANHHTRVNSTIGADRCMSKNDGVRSDIDIVSDHRAILDYRSGMYGGHHRLLSEIGRIQFSRARRLPILTVHAAAKNGLTLRGEEVRR
jgi:hypothetical protein